MEYLEMVEQIVAAEHSAKDLVREGRRRQEELERSADEELERRREDYRQRAARRLELVEQTEQAAAEEAIARLEEEQRQALERVEALYLQKREEWVETLFRRIAGVEP